MACLLLPTAASPAVLLVRVRHRGCTQDGGPGHTVKLTACGGLQALHPYHVRVLVPTYKETLEIVAKTVHAAYNAPLPYGCLRTIYVCDDGKDGSKRKWYVLDADD